MNKFRLIEFNELDSTNKYIKDNLDRLSPFDCIIAEQQTSGYGRMKRSWFDNKDNLSFSILLETKNLERLGLVTQFAAVAVLNSLKKHGIKASIKWPNDIIVSGKKICGILTETVLDKSKVSVILGIGLNVNNEIFTDELRFKATSIFNETKEKSEPKTILMNILDELESLFEQFEAETDEFMTVVRENSALIGKVVRLYEGDEVEVIDIDSLGRLKVNNNGKILTYVGSEVSLKNNYNS